MSYDESSIVVIEDDIEKIKQSPSMYIGYRKWEAVLHLIKEVIQNSIDEGAVPESSCDTITVEINEQNKQITVKDNGRGIPLGMLEKVCTVIQSSGKFNKGGKNAYSKAAGMNGVGLTCCNALAVLFIISATRDGKKKTSVFEFGHLVDTKTVDAPNSKNGTSISFIINEEIVGKAKFNSQDVLDLCKTMSYLSPNMKMKCKVEKKNGTSYEEKYHSKEGIKDLISELAGEHALIKPVYFTEGKNDEDTVEVAFTYAPEAECLKDNDFIIVSYCNFCTTIEGGKHEKGFREGLANSITRYVRENLLNKKEAAKLNVNADDARMGLIAVVNVTTLNAQFSGQIKAKLVSEDIEPFVRQATTTNVSKWLKANEKQAKRIGEWVKTNTKIRQKANEDRKTVIKSDGFMNAFSKNKITGLSVATGKENLELFIVEGKSASGSVKQGRDLQHMEVFELRG